MRALMFAANAKDALAHTQYMAARLLDKWPANPGAEKKRADLAASLYARAKQQGYPFHTEEPTSQSALLRNNGTFRSSTSSNLNLDHNSGRSFRKK